MELWEMFMAGLLSEREFFVELAEASFYGDMSAVFKRMDLQMRCRFTDWKYGIIITRRTELAA